MVDGVNGEAPKRLMCDNCGQPLGPLPPSAKHKRFCSPTCRQDWHRERRRHALERLEKEEAGREQRK